MESQSVRYRRLLESERKAVLALLSKSNHPFDSEPVSDEDYASFAHDRFVSVRAINIDSQKLQLINAALDRIDSGEFGYCMDCGEPIAPKRLSVLPWATRCLRCEELASDPGNVAA
jgi:DnaK suppressor protein